MGPSLSSREARDTASVQRPTDSEDAWGWKTSGPVWWRRCLHISEVAIPYKPNLGLSSSFLPGMVQLPRVRIAPMPSSQPPSLATSKCIVGSRLDLSRAETPGNRAKFCANQTDVGAATLPRGTGQTGVYCTSRWDLEYVKSTYKLLTMLSVPEYKKYKL